MRLFLIAALAATLSLAGCGKSEEPASTPANSTTAVPGTKASSDADTAADTSKGDRDGTDMPGGPGKP